LLEISAARISVQHDDLEALADFALAREMIARPAAPPGDHWLLFGFRWIVPIIALALLFGGAVYYVTFERPADPHPMYWSPKDNSAFVLTNELAGGRGPDIELTAYDQLPPDVAIAMTPRDASRIDNRVLPKDFAGGIAILAGAQRIGRWAVDVHVPLAAMASLAIVAFIARRLFGDVVALISVPLLATIPAFWITNASPISTDTYALLFFLAAAVPIVAVNQPRALRYPILAGLLFGVSITFRYSNTVLLVPVVLAYLVAVKDLRRAILGLALFGLATLPAIAAIGLFNELVYGNPTSTGYSIVNRLLADTVNPTNTGQLGGIVRVTPGAYLDFARMYLTHPFISGVLLFGLASSATIGWRSARLRPYAVLTLATFAVLFLFNGARETNGIEAFFLRASFLRYLLPAFALAAPPAAFGLVRLASAWRASVDGLFSIPLPLFRVPAVAMVILAFWGLLAIWLGGSVFYTFLSEDGGVRATRRTVHILDDQRTELLATIEPGALLLSQRLDKTVFPERESLVAAFLSQNEQPVPKNRVNIWSLTPDESRLADAIGKVDAAGFRLYVAQDSINFFNADLLHEQLASTGLGLCRFLDVDSVPLFRVIQLDDPEDRAGCTPQHLYLPPEAPLIRPLAPTDVLDTVLDR
jgi:hypothetical protein